MSPKKRQRHCRHRDDKTVTYLKIFLMEGSNKGVFPWSCFCFVVLDDITSDNIYHTDKSYKDSTLQDEYINHKDVSSLQFMYLMISCDVNKQLFVLILTISKSCDFKIFTILLSLSPQCLCGLSLHVTICTLIYIGDELKLFLTKQMQNRNRNRRVAIPQKTVKNSKLIFITFAFEYTMY